MKYRFLGETGLKVSEVCFGGMTFGGKGYWERIGQVTQEQADRLIGMCLEAGVNFFDTADVYSEGQSEEMLGKALRARRKEAIIATKVRGTMGEGPNDSGLSRHHILEACEGSLRRLNTDYIDLYQLHAWDWTTPLEETLRALDDLVRWGRVRYIGASNFSGWQLMKALAISDRNGWTRFVGLQAYYSLVCRDLELELVPLCREEGVGILPWSPLGGGFLTGKYRRGKPRPEGARRSDPQEQFLQFDEEKGYDIVQELEGIAEAHGAKTPDGKPSVAQAPLNYLLRKPGVTSIVIGAKTEAYLADNLKCADREMTA
jgi:aryl-alcohol dehydrogenase-like predicted oxidoreductase